MPTRRTAPSDAQRPGRRARIRTRRHGVAIARRRGSAYRLLLQPMPNQPNLCAATPVRQPQADAHVDGWDLRAVERAGISERHAASTMGGRRRTRGSKRDGRAHAGGGRSFANGWGPHPEEESSSRTFPGLISRAAKTGNGCSLMVPVSRVEWLTRGTDTVQFLFLGEAAHSIKSVVIGVQKSERERERQNVRQRE